MVRWSTYCAVGFAVYAFLSAVDLKLTAALLHANPGAYESNPFAAACLERHGWDGLAAYKIAGVVAFAGALCLLARRRPKAAAGVVTFGCAVLLAVTTYSHGLLVDSRRQSAEPELVAAEEMSVDTPQEPGIGMADD
jgi:uncharacterized protein DUF5658